MSQFQISDSGAGKSRVQNLIVNLQAIFSFKKKGGRECLPNHHDALCHSCGSHFCFASQMFTLKVV